MINSITYLKGQFLQNLLSAREIASVALSAERGRRTEKVFHMLLRM